MAAAVAATSTTTAARRVPPRTSSPAVREDTSFAVPTIVDGQRIGRRPPIRGRGRSETHAPGELERPTAMHFLDPNHLINSYGTLGIFAIIFAESGLFFGFFLPGDSLLVTAGLLAATHESSRFHLNLAVLLIGVPIAAILGDQVGYWFGDRVGPSLFRRPESRLFKPEHLARAHEFLV